MNKLTESMDKALFERWDFFQHHLYYSDFIAYIFQFDLPNAQPCLFLPSLQNALSMPENRTVSLTIFSILQYSHIAITLVLFLYSSQQVFPQNWNILPYSEEKWFNYTKLCFVFSLPLSLSLNYLKSLIDNTGQLSPPFILRTSIISTAAECFHRRRIHQHVLFLSWRDCFYVQEGMLPR